MPAAARSARSSPRSLNVWSGRYRDAHGTLLAHGTRPARRSPRGVRAIPAAVGEDLAGLEPDRLAEELGGGPRIEHDHGRVVFGIGDVVGRGDGAGSGPPDGRTKDPPAPVVRPGAPASQRASLRDPPFEPAVQDLDLRWVTVDGAGPAEAERTRAEVVRVGDDVGPIADPEPLHRRGEPLGPRQHERERVIRFREIGRPVAQDGAGDVSGFVPRRARAVLAPAEVDHDEVRIAHALGDAGRGDQSVGPGGHPAR